MNDLIKQYNNLTEEEKRVLLIYKSQLSYFINNADNINDENASEYITKYEEFKKIIESPENIFIKLSVFQDVSFDSFENFLKSIDIIREKLNCLYGKILLLNDMVLFRCSSVKDKKNISKIAIGNFISTSTDFETAENFFSYDGLNVTYVIKVKSGTPVLVIPYSVKLHIKDNKKILKVVADDNQNEIILFKKHLKVELEKQEEENDEIFICIKASALDKTKSLL